MIGVLPAAITMIMVSPTARPKPIIRAEKIPEEATGSMMVQTTCQRLAPRAAEAAVSDLGTLEMASSAMVKITGMTAKPMIKPSTRQLRCSKRCSLPRLPVNCGHHMVKSAIFLPVEGSV